MFLLYRVILLYHVPVITSEHGHEIYYPLLYSSGQHSDLFKRCIQYYSVIIMCVIGNVNNIKE